MRVGLSIALVALTTAPAIGAAVTGVCPPSASSVAPTVSADRDTPRVGGRAIVVAARQDGPADRPRARELGVRPGVLPPGRWNAITDVAGVLVGHRTIVRGDSIRTGVTAILPHAGNLFREKVPAAIHVGNGFGKLTGVTQVRELGNLETPILLTSTLAVPRVADALISYMLELPGNEDVRSINPVVGETNDGYLNDIRARAITPQDVYAALREARSGEVPEGSVGAGTGTVTFGFKGGIGTSSRVLPARLGGWTVGVLVQSNYGGVLRIDGAPVGEELSQYYLRDLLEPAAPAAADAGIASMPPDRGDGSCMIVVATDAPLSARNLERLAARAMLGLARTGSPSTNGSGDYVIAFSVHPGARIGEGGASAAGEPGAPAAAPLANDAVSPLFLAAVEATEEAVYNSLFRATTVTGRDGHRAEALPLDRVLEILEHHRVVR